MKAIRYFFLSLCATALLLFSACVPAGLDPKLPQYYSPLKDAKYVSTGDTIIVRYGPVLSASNADGLKFGVQGSLSGLHTGETILADDHKTVIFKPSKPFTAGEQVQVNVSGLSLGLGSIFSPLSYSFSVAVNQQPGGIAPAAPAASAPGPAFPNFLTLPQDIPHYTVSKTSTIPGEGYIFVAPFYWTKSTLGSYLLILNTQGQIIYYQSVASGLSGFDFKVQPNGLLSYFNQKDEAFYLLNNHYQVVDKYTAENGYTADLHDLQILPNGNALLMAYDNETVDLSQVVPGGQKNATATGLIIQELDPSRNVIFEWRSWDHFAFTDSNADLTGRQVDLVHGNALALANDGNLLLSSRDQSEITKIDLNSGAVMWRMGGKANMFNFGSSQTYAYQHDVRQLPDGDITVFDNQGTQTNPAASQAIEYKVDETKMTVTEVWNYIHNPAVFGSFMGDTQRLADGNTFMDWGAAVATDAGYSYVTMTEVAPDGSTLFELSFDQPYVSYRAFLLPWQGFPDTLPDLAFKVDDTGITLGYSWNGATEVASYNVYGGSSPAALSLIESQVKTDFETQSHLSGLPANECYFQVAALDKSRNEMARSKVISTDETKCPSTH